MQTVDDDYNSDYNRGSVISQYCKYIGVLVFQYPARTSRSWRVLDECNVPETISLMATLFGLGCLPYCDRPY